jgi:hypothetical protein
VAELARSRSSIEVAWPDECIYLVGARNLAERGTLDTQYYLTSSLLRRGYPHRDVHMPGYVLALAPFVEAFGTTLTAAAWLNRLLFCAALLLVFLLGDRVLESRTQALSAAALLAVCPPFPGYLFVAYPEMLTAVAFLIGLAWLVSGGGRAHAVVAGVLYAAGAVVRETLLVALPLYAARIPRREFWRGFAPSALATLLLVVAPLSRDRAIHPNALYPSVVEEALRSESPLATLAGALLDNVAANLSSLTEARPASSAEDAVLAFMFLVGLTAGAAHRLLPKGARPLLLATAVSLALLSLAVLCLYVVRVRGGVWGGVRAYMCFMPLLVVFATPLLFRVRGLRWRLATAAGVVAAMLWLADWQLYAFMRYKGSDHEDQERHERYVASYVERFAPRRLVGRLFLYGLRHYPTEIVWSLPRDYAELRALEEKVPFEFIVIPERSPLRLFFVRNPRYLRVNKEDRGAELLIWRRLD